MCPRVLRTRVLDGRTLARRIGPVGRRGVGAVVVATGPARGFDWPECRAACSRLADCCSLRRRCPACRVDQWRSSCFRAPAAASLPSVDRRVRAGADWRCRPVPTVRVVGVSDFDFDSDSRLESARCRRCCPCPTVGLRRHSPYRDFDRCPRFRRRRFPRLACLVPGLPGGLSAPISLSPVPAVGSTCSF